MGFLLLPALLLQTAPAIRPFSRSTKRNFRAAASAEVSNRIQQFAIRRGGSRRRGVPALGSLLIVAKRRSTSINVASLVTTPRRVVPRISPSSPAYRHSGRIG